MVETGQIVSGKYKLLRLLGDGGMGSVYEAEHMVLGTHVALKILHTDLARRAGLIDRFLQEARVSAQIRSPHVVHVTDVERSPEGIAYLVMELLQGETLAGVIKRERKLSVGTAVEYTSQILEALEAAHSLGVIHRDLKPDNVFVTFLGGKPVLKLIDFGIAKLKEQQGGAAQKNLTVAGMLMGTPEYMAPEQAYSAASVDVRADLYAVGCMLYEMLSGQPPVSGEDPRVVVLKVERGEVTPLVQLTPGIAPEMAGFVHRAMAPKPELRFASATEMRLALDKVASGKGGVVRAGTQALAMDKTAKPGEIGSGTVMGAPSPAALASPGSGPPPAMDALNQPAGGGTLKAPPINPAALGMPNTGPPPPQHMQQPYGPAPARSAYEPSAPTRQPPGRKKSGGSGLVIALAIVALLLGAGAVVAYVMSTQSSDGPVVQPLPTMTTPTATPTTPGTQPTTPTTVATAPPTLTPNNKPPVYTPPQNPTAHPADAGAGPHPSASGSSAPPAITFPIPFPSGMPPMPSSFPFPVPSGFPGFPPPP